MPVQSKQYGDQSDAIELLKLRPGEVCLSMFDLLVDKRR